MTGEPFSDQLRAAVRASGVTQYRIAKETGIAQPHLSTFLSGQTGLSMASVDILFQYLGLHVSSRKKRKRA